jgi:hypothetical protein
MVDVFALSRDVTVLHRQAASAKCLQQCVKQQHHQLMGIGMVNTGLDTYSLVGRG